MTSSGDFPAPATGRGWRGRVAQWNRLEWFIVFCTLLGLAIRCYGISTRGAWWDEVAVWHDALSGHRTPQEAPLNTWAAWLSMFLMRRDDTIALHVAPVLFGAATVPVISRIAQKLAGAWAGAIAAFIAACSPLLAHFSQEARPYSLLILLTTLQLSCGTSLALSWSRRRLIWVGVVSAAAMATHLVAAPFTIGLGAALLFGIAHNADGLTRRDSLRRAGMLLLVGGLALAVGLSWTLFRPPFAPVMTGRYALGLYEFVRFCAVESTLASYTAGRPWGTNDLLTICVLLVAVFGIERLVRTRGWSVALAIVLPVVSLLSGLYLQLGEKANWPWFRYATPMLAPTLILIAVGIASVGPAGWRVVLAGLLFAIWLRPDAGLRNWALGAPQTRGTDQKRLAEALQLVAPRLTGIVFLAQVSTFADESDRLISSYALSRRDSLPVYYFGKDKHYYVVDFKSTPGSIDVPVREDHPALSVPPGDYALVVGWDAFRGCGFLDPPMQDAPDSRANPAYVMCRSVRP